MRALDHLVLPTADLGMSRARLSSLGFTVAPVGVHPFGTVNACVYLADGTFLEPLIVGDAAAAHAAADAGNVFVGRDASFRAANGDEGFSAAVFATDDADRDHANFLAGGVSAGPRLDFSRPFVDATGKTDMASFRLAFAGTDAAPDVLVFTCERVNAPKVDRGALQTHRNGVRSIAEIVLTAADPAEHAGFLARIAGVGAEPVASGVAFPLANGRMTVLSPESFAERFGTPGPTASGPRFAAIVFSVAPSGDWRRLAAAGGQRVDDLVVVPPAPGQGAVFAFRADR